VLLTPERYSWNHVKDKNDAQNDYRINKNIKMKHEKLKITRIAAIRKMYLPCDRNSGIKIIQFGGTQRDLLILLSISCLNLELCQLFL